MNILISNDDGMTAPGIKLLCEALSGIKGARLYVCVPESERSCIGHGITVLKDLYLEDYPADKLGSSVVWAAKCSGTPADCIRLALCVLKEQEIRIDLVCAGINNGSNTGSDINYSGTIGAAREAVLDGFPAIAFSSSKGTDCLDNFRIIVPEIVKRFAGRIPEKTILNVNAPNIPWNSVKGYRTANLAHLYYPPIYTLMDDGKKPGEALSSRRRYAFASFTVENKSEEQENDDKLMSDGYITVSLIPLLQDAGSMNSLVDSLLP